MRRSRFFRRLAASALGFCLVGCNTSRPVSYFGKADHQYYKTVAQDIQYPDVSIPIADAVAISQRPRTVRDGLEGEIREMSLSEAVQLALTNNKFIRTRNLANTLVQNPQNVASIYDPALRETAFLLGSRGVEAALADFDTNFTTSLLMGRNSQVQNTLLPTPGLVANNETGVFTSQLSKQFAYGASLALNHNWNYLDTNVPGTLFPSSYTGTLQAQYRQPMWAGSGTEYTRIAGPSRSGLGGLLGVNQGVAIARINQDISLADFELSVITMVKDVEDLYWELYLAYRQYDAETVARRSALKSWRDTRELMKLGARGGDAAAEALARDNYLDTRARLENALANVYNVENTFRRILGLPVNDGQLIRPSEEPLAAEYLVSWEPSVLNALQSRVELRRQKWQIKSLELQRIAAENACNPRLDFVTSYQVNGFGDRLWSQTRADGVTPEGYHSAYGTLAGGDLTGWTMGLEFSMPIGLRSARAQLQNIELQLVKSREGLAAQEVDISHELAAAIQQIDNAYTTAKTYFDRRVAAAKRESATRERFREGEANLDLLLRAQASHAAAEVSYYTSLIRYNQAINDFHMRRGDLLATNHIYLAEGPWNDDAMRDLDRRNAERAHAISVEGLYQTKPAAFSSPVPAPASIENGAE